jgi:signal recognition particle GTPase
MVEPGFPKPFVDHMTVDDLPPERPRFDKDGDEIMEAIDKELAELPEGGKGGEMIIEPNQELAFLETFLTKTLQAIKKKKRKISETEEDEEEEGESARSRRWLRRTPKHPNKVDKVGGVKINISKRRRLSADPTPEEEKKLLEEEVKPATAESVLEDLPDYEKVKMLEDEDDEDEEIDLTTVEDKKVLCDWDKSVWRQAIIKGRRRLPVTTEARSPPIDTYVVIKVDEK